MPPRVLLVLHRQESCPGRIAALLAAKGYVLDIRRPALGDPLPRDLALYAGVAVFGGPMSANDEHLAFIRAEIDWIGHVLARDVPYLGICLGAQLLARQLGGRVMGHAEGQVEVGFHPIIPTAEGRPVLPRPLHVYQWHREGFTLPKDATLLAAGRVFENQFFRYGERAYGVQFHPEVTRAIMCRWLKSPDELTGRRGSQSVFEQHVRRVAHEPALARWLDGFLSRWVSSSDAAMPA